MKKNSQKPESAIYQKLKIAEDLFNLAYSVKSHQLKLKHPDWSNEMIHQRTIELIDRGCA